MSATSLSWMQRAAGRVEPSSGEEKGVATGWRHQLPVHSPVSWGAWWTGLRAALGATRAAAAEERVVALLRECYAPSAVLLTESGTTALTAALRGVLQDRRDAPIALPAYGCYDLATAAAGAGASVLLYDVDPHTLGPSMPQLGAALRRGAAAVVVAHLYGYPVDLRDINRLAAEADAVVIEDAAQAAGATLHGRPAGTQSSLAVLSFGRGKGLTGGSGGALLARDDAGLRVLERARQLLGEPRRGGRELLVVAAQLLFEHPDRYGIPAALPFLELGRTVYRAPRALRKPTPASCAIVAGTWTRAARAAETRQRNAERLVSVLREREGVSTIRPLEGARPGYLRLPLLASPEVCRAAALPAARRLGIMPGYPKALCDLEPLGPRCENRDAAFPGARLVAERLYTLPTHGRLAPRDLSALEAWIRDAGAGGRR